MPHSALKVDRRAASLGKQVTLETGKDRDTVSLPEPSELNAALPTP